MRSRYPRAFLTASVFAPWNRGRQRCNFCVLVSTVVLTALLTAVQPAEVSVGLSIATQPIPGGPGRATDVARGG